MTRGQQLHGDGYGARPWWVWIPVHSYIPGGTSPSCGNARGVGGLARQLLQLFHALESL
jgi:hypothetical protein